MSSYGLTLPFPPEPLSKVDDVPRCAGVYEIRNDRHGLRYIGSSVNLRRRWKFHLYCFRTGKHHSQRMQRTYDKYGEGIFTFHVLELCEQQLRLVAEQRWLDSTNAASRRDFYNASPTAGSNLGFAVSDETRKKMSKSQKGRTFSPEAIEKMRNAKLGRKLSESHRATLSAVRTGKKLPKRSDGFKQQFRKLTPEQLVELRRLRSTGWKLSELAKRFGIAISTTHRIVTGESCA